MTAKACRPRRVAWLGTVLVVALVRPLAAQPPDAAPESSSSVIAVDDLRAPTTPAFSLLGVTPTSVDRPQNTRALTLNLLSAVNAGAGIPKDYALELTPYWCLSHPNLSFDDYYSQRPELSVMRTFAVSMATAPLSDDSVTGTQIALGMRAMVVPGRANPLLEKLRDELHALDQQLMMGMGQGMAALEHERDRYAKRRDSATDDVARALWDGRIRDVEAKIAELAQRAAAASPDPRAADARRAEQRAQAAELTARLRELDAQRVGFMLAVAEAQIWAFANDTFNASQLTRAGLWVTPSYRVRPCDLSAADSALECATSLDFIAVLRYVSDRTSLLNPNRWDVGARVAWQVNKQVAVSLEAVRRNRPLASTSTAATDRTVAVVEYRVRDDMLFFASFGKDFEKGDGRKTLVTLMGLNVGLGKKPVLDMSK